MRIQFTALQSVALSISQEIVPVEHYLRQPQRLIYALIEPERVEQRSASLFRFKLSPLKFLMLKIEPTVDLKVWTGADGVLRLQSMATQLKGLETFDTGFDLKLIGNLAPYRRGQKTELRGQADLMVQVDLPPSWVFMSRTLVQATGNALLKSVLTTMRQRLERQLLQDYENWVKSQSLESMTGRSTHGLREVALSS
ncbi:hypothetical protein PROH_15980 [Prochlorothrix hollandica PCC 9006 = CALU 1027]|uniref:DUF1997 domain-containing protein n=1 Tax=Prochlorothrix hollandica PCC 9006 = CALU 1027 TaxID=317619 RepID=A0A0M2PX38_PROHO|nr:hypothetical protein PROH_15980 [Prochlorothrix hollandica PCC 9006 = CALU 1027]